MAALSAEVTLEAREKLQSLGFWIPQVGGHKAWLKVLCTTLLDSGGVTSEALLLSRPLCLVSTWTVLLYQSSHDGTCSVQYIQPLHLHTTT